MPREANLGRKLDTLRRRANMSVVEVCRRTGASRPTVYNWCAGKSISPAYRPIVEKLIARLSTR